MPRSTSRAATWRPTPRPSSSSSTTTTGARRWARTGRLRIERGARLAVPARGVRRRLRRPRPPHPGAGLTCAELLEHSSSPTEPGWCGPWSSASRHRGPDAAGVIDLSPRTPLQLGHRRLSIIDLSTAADQPFVSDGLHLSYNGELYNYRELRDDAARQGRPVPDRVRHRGRPGVLAALGRRRALPRLRGMFAFALYDERAGALTLVRDPLGIKPLYVLPRGDGIVFASELKALVAAVGPELTVDPARARRVHAVLLPARGAVRHQGGLQAPAGIVGRVADRRHAAGPDATGSPAEEAAGGRAAARPPTWRRCSRSPWPPTWSPTSRSPPSSAAVSTPA